MKNFQHQLQFLTCGITCRFYFSGQVDRASNAEKAEAGSIPGWVKPKTLKIGICGFPIWPSALKPRSGPTGFYTKNITNIILSLQEKSKSWLVIPNLRITLIKMFIPASWSSGNAFVSEAGGLGFKPRVGQIENSVANGLPPLRHFFERSFVAREQWCGYGHRKLVTRFGVIQL